MEKIIEELRNANLEIEEIKAKKEALRKKLEEHRSAVTPEELEEIKAEKAKLDAELSAKIALRDKLSELSEEQKKSGGRTIKMFDEKELRVTDLLRYDMNAPELREMKSAFEKRAETFKKEKGFRISADEVVGMLNSGKRNITTLSDGIAKPKLVGEISNPFNELITIFDQVNTVNMEGAGSYQKPFLKASQTASEKTEGTAQSSSDPSFGTVLISPKNVAVTTFVSREVQKVTPINYLAKVTESAMIALKVKLSQNIATKIKTGTDEKSNVMYQTLNASADNGLLNGTKGQINEKTLRQIAMAYGGDTNVYGNAVLYLNKQDLIAFGDVRGTSNKNAVYEITPNPVNPNIGTIKDGGLTVQYCLVPTLTAHNGTAQTTSPVQTMIYGSPLNFEEAIFGDFGVRVSDEYKFAEGLLTVMGEIMADGAVAVDKGFVVVTIPKTSG